MTDNPFVKEEYNFYEYRPDDSTIEYALWENGVVTEEELMALWLAAQEARRHVLDG